MTNSGRGGVITKLDKNKAGEWDWDREIRHSSHCHQTSPSPKALHSRCKRLLLFAQWRRSKAQLIAFGHANQGLSLDCCGCVRILGAEVHGAVGNSVPDAEVMESHTRQDVTGWRDKEELIRYGSNWNTVEARGEALVSNTYWNIPSPLILLSQQTLHNHSDTVFRPTILTIDTPTEILLVNYAKYIQFSHFL